MFISCARCVVVNIPALNGRNPASADVKYDDWRLPRALLPRQYKVRLLPFLNEGNFSTHGRVEILLECMQETDFVVIHMVDIVIVKDTLQVNNFIKFEYALLRDYLSCHRFRIWLKCVRWKFNPTWKISSANFCSFPPRMIRCRSANSISCRWISLGSWTTNSTGSIGRPTRTTEFKSKQFDFSTQPNFNCLHQCVVVVVEWMNEKVLGHHSVLSDGRPASVPLLRRTWNESEIPNNAGTWNISNVALQHATKKDHGQVISFSISILSTISTTFDLVRSCLDTFGTSTKRRCRCRPTFWRSSCPNWKVSTQRRIRVAASTSASGVGRQRRIRPSKLRWKSKFLCWFDQRFEFLMIKLVFWCCCRYARSLGPRVLSFLEGYFNVSFPLPKLDMFAIPDFAVGAMENWGLVTYR